MFAGRKLTIQFANLPLAGIRTNNGIITIKFQTAETENGIQTSAHHPTQIPGSTPLSLCRVRFAVIDFAWASSAYCEHEFLG